MLNLPQYQEIDVIYAGTRTVVYRALRLSDRQPVIIKVLRNPHPHFNELVQFRNQYVITRNLSSPFIVQPLALERQNNGYVLVMPDEGSVSLQNYWQRQAQTQAEWLAIASQLAEALHILGQNRIIHKDIKPANILIHPQTTQVQLIDFSIASLLPKEQQQLVNPNHLEGTLAYISPEQTGRMNRRLDYRTDFYSLGVTLYELLTGRLPFGLSDPMELVHCHIAQTPTAPIELLDAQGQSCPAMLSAIVMKLMAKNAEDRYQSALGLKHDLERCVRSREETGNIPEFELGERDVGDRFLIPDKLYGREAEVQTLLDAFERVSQGPSELMLVAGFSGIGKTTVVNEVHKPITRQRGYFIKGKFDQFNYDIPFSAFIQAFRSLVHQLLSESDAEQQIWKIKILEALDKNAQVIIDLIPELTRILGIQPAVSELSGTAAQHRFNRLLQRFIQVFTTVEHPLVIFVDDLQWADSASLNLIQTLLARSQTKYLLLLGAYRDNEVSPAHPLILTLDELAKDQAKIQAITLSPLSETSLNYLIADTFHTSVLRAKTLTRLVIQKTQGNPFFATQFLRSLYQEQLITFDHDAGHWQCDIVKVHEASLTNDVVELMMQQLQKLPTSTQDILKLAACIGAQFDLETLAIVSENTQVDVAIALWKALQEGLILPQSVLYKFYIGESTAQQHTSEETLHYRFLHDRVQQASYALIPEAIKPQTHYHIGQLLLQQFTAVTSEQPTFAIVGHLNFAQGLLNTKNEQLRLAQLNLEAGQKALKSVAYEATIQYCITGIKLLSINSWNTDYQLRLELTKTLASAYLSNGNYAELDRVVEEVLPHIPLPAEQADFFTLQIVAYSLRGRYTEASDWGLKGLKRLGTDLKTADITDLLTQESARIEQAMSDQPISSLLNRPTDVPAAVKAEMKLCIALDPPSYITGNIDMYSFVSLRATRHSIEHGNTAESAKAYANYGLLLGLMHGRYQDGYEFTKMAVQLATQLNNRVQQCNTALLLGGWVHVWARPIQGAAQTSYEGFIAGMESGETQFAAYNLFSYIFNLLFQGYDVSSIEADIQKYLVVAKSIQAELLSTALAGTQIFIQSLLNVPSGREPQCSHSLIDEAQAVIAAGEDAKIVMGIGLYYSLEMHLACIMGTFDQGFAFLEKVKPILSSLAGFTTYSYYFYYGSLILLNQSKSADGSNKYSIDWRSIETNQQQLNVWSESCPENFRHKYLLVEAESHRCRHEHCLAMELYDRAIAEAATNEYIQEEALANELAAKFYLDWGKAKIAAVYMEDAYYCYARWGAKAKIAHLEAHYPQLLTPILQRQQVELTSLDSLTSLTQTLTTSLQSQNSSTHLSDALDLATILQAAQKLASTIELEQLLQEIAEIILTNAGAQKMALLTPNEDQWQLQISAERGTENTVMLKTSARTLISQDCVPIRLIQYVKNTQATVLISEVRTKISGILEGYLLKYQPQSVLCVPLLHQGNLVAIAYLEHRTTKGVFTANRQAIIEFLGAQGAVALQNAQLYQQSQQAQNQAEQALSELQQAQLQLVQSEKMSALGNLVAGIAHEINNPVGFLQGNIQPAQDYVQDLLGLIDLYQEKVSTPDPDIEEEIEKIDLDFIREDLPKLINSMNTGVERIRNISDSLRTFSRKDQEHKIGFNLHDGLDSTLLILKHRTKANEQHPKIKIIKNYNELPEIQCFPGQLNQVFMNILANAIDAFEEGNQGKTYQEIEVNLNKITISTLNLKERVEIKIQDNGCGMRPETVARIFEQGFTTKEVGRGTGLGMAIAYQIITDKHGGSLTCQSERGNGTIFTISLPL